MHRISSETLELAKKHAEQLRKQGVSLVLIGESMSTSEHLKPSKEQLEFLEKAGKQVQVHAEVILRLVEVAEKDEQQSTEAYGAAVTEHTKATKLLIEAHKKSFDQPPSKALYQAKKSEK
jgi:hypothetical protein